MQTTPSTFPIVIYLKIEGISIIFIYSRSLEETRSKRLVEDQDSSRSKKRRRCWFELIYSRWRYWKALLKDYLWEILLFFNIGDISFGEMIRRKAIRREEGGKPYLLPSIIFHFYLFIIQRLDPSSIETFKGINGGVALPSSMGVEDKRSPVKVLRGRETGRSLVCHPCSSTLSLFFFFSKKIGDEEDTIRCRFSFFFFFSLIQISHIAFDLQSNDDFSRCGVSLITEQMKSGLICTGILSSKSNGSHFFFFGEGMINGPIWDIWSILFSFNRYFYYIYSSFSLFLWNYFFIIDHQSVLLR